VASLFCVSRGRADIVSIRERRARMRDLVMERRIVGEVGICCGLKFEIPFLEDIVVRNKCSVRTLNSELRF